MVTSAFQWVEKLFHIWATKWKNQNINAVNPPPNPHHFLSIINFFLWRSRAIHVLIRFFILPFSLDSLLLGCEIGKAQNNCDLSVIKKRLNLSIWGFRWKITKLTGILKTQSRQNSGTPRCGMWRFFNFEFFYSIIWPSNSVTSQSSTINYIIYKKYFLRIPRFWFWKFRLLSNIVSWDLDLFGHAVFHIM